MSELPKPSTPRNAAGPDDRRRWSARCSRANVQLIGRVGGDPDVRFASEASGGGAWARFSVATDSPDGDVDTPDWHTVIVRDRLAQFVARYLTRGRLVDVSGWLTYRVVEERQCAHRLAEIRASDVLLLDRPGRSDGQGAQI
jgi:single-strand DNA-binding protein